MVYRGLIHSQRLLSTDKVECMGPSLTMMLQTASSTPAPEKNRRLKYPPKALPSSTLRRVLNPLEGTAWESSGSPIADYNPKPLNP